MWRELGGVFEKADQVVALAIVPQDRTQHHGEPELLAEAVVGTHFLTHRAAAGEVGPEPFVVGVAVARAAQHFAGAAAINLVWLPAEDVGEGAVDEHDFGRAVGDVDGRVGLVDRQLDRLEPACLVPVDRPVHIHRPRRAFCAPSKCSRVGDGEGKQLHYRHRPMGFKLPQNRMMVAKALRTPAISACRAV